MTAPLICARGIGREYCLGGATVKALHDVSLDVSRGELLAIMGPSGSGKSTLMHVLGLLDRPSRGRYLFAGQDVEQLDSDTLAGLRNRQIGFVFQAYNLLPRATAIENVELPLLYGKVPRQQRRRRAEQALAMVDLDHRGQHRPNTLSGGEQQRVAIARAMVNQPELIVADEPTGALDSHTGRQVLALFQRLNERGMTVILVTHDAGVADHARRVIGMRDGSLVDDKMVLSPLAALSSQRPGEDSTGPNSAVADAITRSRP